MKIPDITPEQEVFYQLYRYWWWEGWFWGFLCACGAAGVLGLVIR